MKKRARPEPRVAPNVPKAPTEGALAAATGALGAPLPSAAAGAGAGESAGAGTGAPDFSLSDMCVFFG